MTYTAGNLIVPADLNGFLDNNTYYMHHMWGKGSGDYGYGQTKINQVAQHDLIKADHWSKLVDYITKMANHQGTAITSLGTVATGDLVKIINAIDNDIQAIQTNRLNSVAFDSSYSTSYTYPAQWSNYVQFNGTINFPSADQARYFFNAGGKVGFSCNHGSGGRIVNSLIRAICQNMGTVWISSKNIQKSGGASGSWDSSNLSGSYYSMPSGRILHQTASSSEGGNTTRTVGTGSRARVIGAYYTPGTYIDLNVSGGGSSISFSFIFDEIPDGFVCSATSEVTVTIKPPSTTYLTNTWGTATVSINASGS